MTREISHASCPRPTRVGPWLGLRVLTVLAAAVLWASVPGAQQPSPPPPQQPKTAPPATEPAPPQARPGEPQQPIFRTGINFVRVDVIVTDKRGEPVADLQAADFEVSEDGKPQTIETFKLVRVTGIPEGGEAPRQIRTDYDEESEASRDDVRVFVILLDDYHVRRGASLGVREPLVRFIRTQLSPLDLVGVMYPLTPVSDVRLTRNHDAVVRAIEQFMGRKYDYTPRNPFEEKYSMYPAEVVERVRNQVSLSALKSIAIHLGGLREGRKAVVLVSEGYSNYLPPQLRDPIADMPGLGNPTRSTPGVGDNNPNEERAQFFNNLDLISDLRSVYDAANRANTAIYALDPRGLAAFEFDINEGVGMRTDRNVLNASMDTLRILADETDGRAIVNRNDLEGGLRQIVRDSSTYYLIGYSSSQAPTDGKFHEIKVKVKRQGVQIRARKGYWALTAEETARATAPAGPGPDPGITEALAAVESTRRDRYIRTWIGMAPGASGRTRVTFVWEAVPPAVGRPADAARVEVVALTAAGGDGTPYFRGDVPASVNAAPGVPSSLNVLAGRTEFEAAPGRLDLRLSVRDADGRPLDSDFSDVTVPDFTAPQTRLSTLEVVRARSARELQAVKSDARAQPTAAREFRRTERLLIRFEASAAGGATPDTKVRLLNRAGKPMTDLAVERLGEAGGRFQVEVPLAGLPAGEFLVEVRAGEAEGGVRQIVGFRVTG